MTFEFCSLMKFWEEQRVRAFESRVLRRIFGSTEVGMTGSGKIL
jgi:hypothetical protein